MAVTALSVALDRTVYSRFEPEHDTVSVTVTPTGTPSGGQEFTLSLIKARRARDVVVATWTVAFSGTSAVTQEIALSGIVDSQEIPLVRRGKYFFRASTTGPVIGNSADFRVAPITIDRMTSEYLYGLDLKALQMLAVLDQPAKIAGVEVVDVSPGHPRAWFPLTHTGPVGEVIATAVVAGGSTTTAINITGATDSDWVGQWFQFGAESSVISSVGVGVINLATAVAIAPPATANVEIRSNTGMHFLSWCSGPQVRVSAAGTYTLRKSASAADGQYIKVRVSYGELETVSETEELLVASRAMDDDAAYGILEKAISELEDTTLGGVFLEPTRIVSQIAVTAAETVGGTSIPSFPGADWDRVGTPISFYRPTGSAYVHIPFVYKPILKFNELNGWIGGNVALSVPTDWIQFNPAGGFVELVPFTLEALGRFVGVLLFQSIRGDAPIPSFWRYDMVAGFRETPAVLIEAVAKIAAVDFLTIAGQATNNAYASKEISRDGVREKIDFTASAMFGIYSASITDYNRWLKQHIPRLRGAFRGPQIDVM